MRKIRKFKFLESIYRSSWTYHSPANLNYYWNFGSLILYVLVLQLASGIFLAMHYIPDIDLAFNSVEHIMRDVEYGWLIRYWHANGATFFFLLVYLHILRNMFYYSYTSPRQPVWVIGVIIFVLMIVTAFLGYVLPWGQMSYWAATVITNLVGTVPIIGDDLLKWLWGGFGVGTVTLRRFYSLHFTLSFVIFALSFVHLFFLHEKGSNNPLGIIFIGYDFIRLLPYYFIKDIHGIIALTYVMLMVVLGYPDYFGHPDNYIPANPQSTPTHIVPEWYFLPFYAMLRSVPNKLLGVSILVGSLVVLLMLPFYVNPLIRSARFRFLANFFFWTFTCDCMLLFWVGGKPLEEPYLLISRCATAYYFIYLMILIPVIERIERYYQKKLAIEKAKRKM
jgi:quinol-cytochrome oxidoreductase complex cytochrome b subunit